VRSGTVRLGSALCAAPRSYVLLAIVVAAFLASSEARAAENGGTVVGTVSLDAPDRQSPAAARNQGFVPRAANALRPPRAFDPRPYIVIVLDGATPPAEDRQAPGQPVRYTIIGESFEQPLLPVVTGSVVEVRNAGRGSPRLYSPQKSDLVRADPIAPRGERQTKKIEPAHQGFELRDRDSVHLRGRIVAFPHRYITLLAPDGRFTIKDVAPGTWKVRVWYRDGWADLAEQTVEVAAKQETKPVKLSLPVKLMTKPAR